jgi:topoisomerase-4 subunit A
MGWIRAMKGHIDLDQELKYKDGDDPRFVFHAETTDKLLLVGANGRFYTLPASPPARRARHGRAGAPDGRPAQRGGDRRAVRPPPRRGCWWPRAAGDGFVVPEDEMLAQTRTGKQVLNVRGRREGLRSRPVAAGR